MADNDLLRRTLARLILRHPFMASVALRLQHLDDPTCETAWTDGIHLAVNPGWFEQLSDDQRLVVVAHETLHVALAHHLRRRGHDPLRWNHACDYAVNALLVGDGLDLPSGALLDPSFGDASAERIYNLLPTSTSSPSPSTPASDPVRALGEVRDQPLPAPPTPGVLQDLLAQHAIVISSLAQQARVSGQDSASAQRARTEAQHPGTVEWQTLLLEFLSSRHAQDYTWCRPNPRYSVLGLFLPALRAAAPDNIAFVVDTSGSIPPEALSAVTAELEGYLRQYTATTLTVLYADAAVTGRASYTYNDLPLHLTPIGGGGTDFRPALTALADDDPPPSCIVYLTDLEGTFPNEPPSIPVIWLVFGNLAPSAPFGKVVSLPF
jgi:predicted metal-dependent peptidase